MERKTKIHSMIAIDVLFSRSSEKKDSPKNTKAIGVNRATFNGQVKLRNRGPDS